MEINEARKLRSGQIVNVFSEEGTCKQTHVIGPNSLRHNAIVSTKEGQEWIWISTNEGLWPSNRVERAQ